MYRTEPLGTGWGQTVYDGTLPTGHCADASPFEAAFWAADFAARHDAFMVVNGAAAGWTCPDGDEPWRESWHSALFDAAHPQVFRAALQEPRRRQAELLRAILPDPFTLPDGCAAKSSSAR